MNGSKKPFIVKLSLSGKQNEDVSYVFSDSLIVNNDTRVSLFGIFWITSTKEVYKNFIKELVNSFLDFYHKSSQAPSQTHIEEGIDYNEFVFESAVRYAHETFLKSLEGFEEKDRDTFDPKKINFTLGALVKDVLYLSGAGSRLFAFYIYPVFTKQRGFSHYASAAILDGKQDFATSNRIFTYLVQGDVGVQGASVALLNQPLFDYIPLDQLKQIVTNNPTEKISQYFHTLLGKIHTKNDFNALFINPCYMGALDFSTSAQRQTASSHSMHGLNSTARGTDTILSPTLKPYVVQFIESFLSTFQKNVKNILQKSISLTKRSPSIFHKIKKFIENITKKSTVFFKNFYSVLKKIFIKIVTYTRASLRMVSVLIQKGPRTSFVIIKEKIKNTPQWLHAKIQPYFSKIHTKKISVQNKTFHFFNKKIDSLQSLPGGSKALLLLSTLFLILFIVSIITLQHKKIEQKNNKEYLENFMKLEQSYTSIQSKFIYESENSIQSQLTELDKELSDFKTKFNKKDEKFDRLTDRITLLRSQIFHITSLEQLTQLGTVPQDIQEDNVSLIPLEHSLALSSSHGIARYSFSDKSLTSLAVPVPSTSQCLGAFQHDSLFSYSQEARSLTVISVLKPTTETYEIKINPLQKNITVGSIFNNKLYLLDGVQGTLFKYSQSSKTFNQGTPVLKKSSDALKGGQSIDIDGSIYVLKNNSTVLKISHGSLAQFALPHIQPPLTSLKKITTQETSPYLFLLDSEHKRIIELDKQTGELKNQYISSRFENLQDIALGQDGKVLFVLNSNQLISIPIK